MKSSGGRKNRGADRGTNSDAEAFALEDGFFEPPYGLNSPDVPCLLIKGLGPGWCDVFQRCVDRISEFLLPLLRLSIWKRKSYLICENMVIVTWGPCDRLDTGVIQPTSF